MSHYIENIAVDNFAKILNNATKNDLKIIEQNLTDIAKDLTVNSLEREIAKNINKLIKNQIKQY